MSNYPPILKKSILTLFWRLDLSFSVIGIAAAIIQLLRGVVNGSIVSFLFGIFLLVPCTSWLLMRSNIKPIADRHLRYQKTFFTFFNICFWILFIVGILILCYQADPYQRPLGFLTTVMFMAGVLVFEVLYSTEKTSRFILPQIILLGVFVAWSQVTNYSGVVGVDPWFHQMFTNILIEDHYLAQDYNYAHFPIFHLLIGQTAILTGLSYKVAALLSVSLMQISCNVIFVYLLAVTVFRSTKVGALASLLVILSPYHIYMSYWSIPNGFAAVFIVIALYLLFRHREVSKLSIALLGLVLSTLILTHTISALCMAILLFTIWGASVVYRRQFPESEAVPLPFYVPIIFMVAMLAWWLMDMSTVGVFSELLMRSFDFHFFMDGPTELMGYTIRLPIEEVYINIGIYLSLFFSLIGVFSMIAMENTPRQFVVAFTGLAPFAITLLAYLAEVAIIPDRWLYFSSVLLGGPLALAILQVGEYWRNRGTIMSISVPVLIVFIFALLAITNPIADHWDPLIPCNRTRDAFFESETCAFHTIAGVSLSPIKTDRYYAESQKWTTNITIPFDDEIYSRDYEGLSSNLVLIRSTVEDEPFSLYTTPYRLDYCLSSDLLRVGFSQMYDSQTVRGYLRQQ